VDDVQAAAETIVGAVKDAAGAIADTAHAVAEKTGGVAEPLPQTRPELLARHRELRHDRDAAPIGSHERAEAMAELGRVEVEIARIERAMDPPLV
jgi:hypothetical protein